MIFSSHILTSKTYVNLNPTAFLLSAVAFASCSQPASAANVSRNIGVTLNAANFDSYNLDVDQNGSTDFTIETAYVPDPVLTVGFDQFKFLFGSNNAVVIDQFTGDGFPAVSRLGLGSVVAASSLFSGPNDTGDLVFYDTIDPVTGNFNGNSGFVGFRFDAPDGLHYGFVDVTVKSLNDVTNPLDLTLGTVVYNDAASVPITVPEPTTLSAVAMIFGLVIRRRRK